MKKIFSIILMLTCVLGLTACSNEVKTMKYDEAEITNQVSAVYQYVSQDYTDEDLTMLAELNDDELDALASILGQYSGIRTEGKVIVTGINSWKGSKDIIGTVNGLGNPEFSVSKKELIVTVPVSGSVHDGSLEVIYDKNCHVTSITTNVKYSMAESMQKAGTNTLIGMGTVFVMLIVIMIIISCFSVIPKIQDSLANKKNKKDIGLESIDNGVQSIVEREEVDETDDLELVAVIAAAIAASEGASSTDGFVVRSIRRIK